MHDVYIHTDIYIQLVHSRGAKIAKAEGGRIGEGANEASERVQRERESEKKQKRSKGEREREIAAILQRRESA